MGTFWKCVLVKFVLNEFVLTKDLVYCKLQKELEVSLLDWKVNALAMELRADLC